MINIMQKPWHHVHRAEITTLNVPSRVVRGHSNIEVAYTVCGKIIRNWREFDPEKHRNLPYLWICPECFPK